MTDQAVNTVWSADYLPFGLADVTLASIDNNLRFAGQYYDRETELHYNYHRYYDPKLGRYLRADPIGLEGAINLFTYVSNNPANSIDLLGLKGWGFSGLGGPTCSGLPRMIERQGQIVVNNAADWICIALSELAKATADCVICTATCTAKVVVPSLVQGELVKRAIKEAAEKLAKESLKKAVPYYNVVDTALTVGQTAVCGVTCIEKRN